MPALTGARRSPNFFCTQSRNSNREARKASVAPMADANDTRTVPNTRPKIAPPTSVRIVAPGIDSAAIAM